MGGPGYDSIGEEELSAVTTVLRTRQISRYRFDDDATGNEPSFTYRFERDLEAKLGIKRCLGMNSCTSALLAGLWALGVGPGDEILVPGYTFVASMAAAAYTGATLRLAEIDEHLTIDPEDVERKITSRTKAIVCVHMLGMPCDMARLTNIAARHGVALIEDCAQAGGGSYRGRRLGGLGAFGALSLNVFKTFTAGDGGVFMTDDERLFERVFAIHDHGAQPFRLGVADAKGLLGLNLRMHELSGAMAWAQLPKLDNNLERLRRLKSEAIRCIGNIEGARVVRSHDPDGECANVLLLQFDCADRARHVADALGSRVLSESGKHNYANIPQLSGQSLPAAIPVAKTTANDFVRGALPRTDDLLSRTLALSVGVRDSYLGAGFGLNLNSTAEDVGRVAAAVHAAVLSS